MHSELYIEMMRRKELIENNSNWEEILSVALKSSDPNRIIQNWIKNDGVIEDECAV